MRGQDHVTNELGVRVTAGRWGPGHLGEWRTSQMLTPAYPGATGVVRFGLDGQPLPHAHGTGQGAHSGRLQADSHAAHDMTNGAVAVSNQSQCVPNPEMMGDMGYRVIRLELSTAPTDLDLLLLRQVVAFARFNKAAAFLTAPKRYPAVLEVTIEGNSSFLNDFTPYLNDSIAQIATDIDPNNESLQSIAVAIASQLNAHIVDWSDVSTIVLARRGRELEERIAGDSSFRQIGVELGIHARRIRSELAKYQKTTDPKAWRRRHDLALMLRIDSLALIVAARRLRRIADDIRRHLPGSHLSKALGRFDQKVPHLVDFRNIAEHIDEYSIGRGRYDASGLEPGDVWRHSRHEKSTYPGERVVIWTINILGIGSGCFALLYILAWIGFAAGIR
jgi:hypothetical protein